MAGIRDLDRLFGAEFAGGFARRTRLDDAQVVLTVSALVDAIAERAEVVNDGWQVSRLDAASQAADGAAGSGPQR